MRYKSLLFILAGLLVFFGCSSKPEEPKTNEAKLAEGISFNQPVYPSFIESVKGLSGPEPWGRWSDGKEVILTFKNPLPEKCELVIRATVLPDNAGRPIPLKVGQWEDDLKITPDPIEKSKDYKMKIKNTDQAKEIRITIPNPAQPGNGDSRTLGIAFISLKILAGK